MTNPAYSISKRELMKGHAAWLEGHDERVFYSHPINAWRIQMMLDHTRNIRGKVLDIGCFTGYVTELIQRQGDKQVVGMDRLEPALERARSRGLSVIQGDIDEVRIEFDAATFDAVVAGHVLDEVYDPDAMLMEVHRVLKPGGRLIVTVPNLASATNRLLMLFGQAPYNLEVRARSGVGHIRMFTFDTLKQILEDRGFLVRRMLSTVFAIPSYKLPLVGRMFPGSEWKQPRFLFSRTLAKIFPRMGETILSVADRDGGVFAAYGSPDPPAQASSQAPPGQEQIH